MGQLIYTGVVGSVLPTGRRRTSYADATSKFRQCQGCVCTAVGGFVLDIVGILMYMIFAEVRAAFLPKGAMSRAQMRRRVARRLRAAALNRLSAGTARPNAQRRERTHGGAPACPSHHTTLTTTANKGRAGTPTKDERRAELRGR